MFMYKCSVDSYLYKFMIGTSVAVLCRSVCESLNSFWIIMVQTPKQFFIAKSRLIAISTVYQPRVYP